MTLFAWGVLSTASAVAGLFFLRFWRDTRDPLFAAFSAAFWLLAANWAALALASPVDETRHRLYALRLAAFLVLIWGIVHKNRRAAP